MSDESGKRAGNRPFFCLSVVFFSFCPQGSVPNLCISSDNLRLQDIRIIGGSSMSRKTLVVLASAIALTACSKKEGGQEGAAVRIAQASPLTGQQAAIGKDNENGVRLAIDEINAQHLTVGGHPLTIEMISEDDQADPRTGTTIAQKFVDDHVNGVIGHLNSGTTIPASKIYADAGIPQISPSATAVKYTQQGYKTAFRLMANDAQQGKALGEFAIKELKARTVAIIDDRTAYGQGLADEFEKAVKAAGGSVAMHEFTNDKANDFTAILTKISGAHADLLFFGGMYGQAAPMAIQMKNLGLSIPMMAGDGARTPEFINLAKSAAEGAVASTPGVPVDSMPKGREFKTKFESKYGKIQNYSPYAYDSVYVMVDAMKRANSTDPKAYLPLLAQTRNFDGVTGKVSFDSKGDLVDGPVTIYKVVNGQWTLLTTVGGAK